MRGRYPGLAKVLPVAHLEVAETPVERWCVDGVPLLVKRDDLSAPAVGGNKVRALQLLLAGVRPQHTLLTVGPTGSTHALAVAHHGRQLGLDTDVITWPQEVHDVARATASRMVTLARVTRTHSTVEAYLRAAARRVGGRVHWVPAGGSSALGALGHASAALELVAQLERAGSPMPDAVVVPLGSGGTVAGLLLGFAIAGVATRVIGVRVVPRILGNRGHVLRLAWSSRRLLQRLAGDAVPPVRASALEIDHSSHGGAYGRQTPRGTAASESLRDAGGPRLDPTYSAKAFGHALAMARGAPDGAILFWLTFDGRWLDASDDTTRGLHSAP